MWIRAGGWVGWSANVDNIFFFKYYVDKGAGGGKTLIHKMWIKRRIFFYEPLPYFLGKK